MKLDARQIEGFLRDPATAQVVLLLGDDVGLIRERARRLVVAVAGSSDDPFRVVELDRETIGAIPEEMSSVPMTGGRRVVRVRDVTDGAHGVVEKVLASIYYCNFSVFQSAPDTWAMSSAARLSAITSAGSMRSISAAVVQPWRRAAASVSDRWTT